MKSNIIAINLAFFCKNKSKSQNFFHDFTVLYAKSIFSFSLQFPNFILNKKHIYTYYTYYVSMHKN